ncbi:MAG: hypothetical protein H6825_12925 [Planctomycetes bacterium]|nr:hypothetical protein [Planctomycetota bacterium]
MKAQRVSLVLATGCLALSVSADAQCPQAEVSMWGAAQTDAYHGWAVDLRGDVAVVGAPGWAASALVAPDGLVSVARWNGSFWAPEQLAKSATMGPGSDFGWSVALNEAGDVLVVGAPGVSGGGHNRGAVAIYEWDTGSDAFVQCFEGLGYADSARLGESVDASGDRVVAGAPIFNGLGGAMHVYERSAPGVWLDKGAFTFGGTSQFGHAVAASGQRIAAGGPFYDAGSVADVGALKVFEWNGTQWLSIADMIGDYAGGEFGFSVDLFEDHLAVGLPGHLSGGGAGRVYMWDGSAYSLKAQAVTPGTNILTGYDVAVGRLRGAFGSPGYPYGGMIQAGATRLLQHVPGSSPPWKFVAGVPFFCTAPETAAWYGQALAMDGKRMIVGAPFASKEGHTYSGRAYVVDLCDSVGSADLEHALPGQGGSVPLLTVDSAPCGEPDVYHVVTGARPWSPAYVVLGASLLELPFKGGVMVPNPDLILSGIQTNGEGRFFFGYEVPSGLPSYSIWMQCWIQDVEGPVGFSSTNGLRLDVPAF